MYILVFRPCLKRSYTVGHLVVTHTLVITVISGGREVGRTDWGGEREREGERWGGEIGEDRWGREVGRRDGGERWEGEREGERGG